MTSSTDYLSWQSELSLQQVFAQADSFAYPHLWNDGVIYLSSIVEQKSRATLIYRCFSEPEKAEILLPEPYNLRTRIHEYGGKPFWLFGNKLIFVNDSDQCLYQLDLSQPNASVDRLTEAGQNHRFADLVRLEDSAYLAVCETHELNQSEPKASIVFIGTGQGLASPVELPMQADFFSNLVVDTIHHKLAWVQWQHPNMPWDETELWVADYEVSASNGKLAINVVSPQRIKLNHQASICQLLFADNGTLFFVADFAGQATDSSKNYWNIWCIDPSDCRSKTQQVTHELAEFGYPHWQFGDARLVALDNKNLLAIASYTEVDELYSVNVESLRQSRIDSSAIGFQNLSSNGEGDAVVLGRYADKNPQLLYYSGDGKTLRPVLKSRTPIQVDDVSLAQHLRYRAKNSSLDAYAYYYPPCNRRYSDDQQSAPPLLVMVHGGPTAKAYGFFDLQKQFWTQRGFAVLDVNHRGSCGYGRTFRDALYGNWGCADSDDIAAAIDSVFTAKLANPEQVCIRGKSAGGYAVLRALTEHAAMFKAGACYYGIGNLITLAETTHKFEKHYTDRLVGEVYTETEVNNPASAFYQRSPINYTSALQSAMIVFQGGEDKIVPPSVAHEIISALKVQNLPHKYVEYAAEGHGFRQPSNNIDAWQQELCFYKQHLHSETIHES